MASSTADIGGHDPATWIDPPRRRDRSDLPFDPAAVARTDPIMLDTNVYIDALKKQLPASIATLAASNPVFHSATAAGELAFTIGRLDPRDARTADSVQAIGEVLERMRPDRTFAPSAAAWTEAAVIAGICARLHRYDAGARRKLLLVALLFTSAAEHAAVLISRNIRDMDLLLRFRPTARVLLYDRIAPTARSAGP